MDKKLPALFLALVLLMLLSGRWPFPAHADSITDSLPLSELTEEEQDRLWRSVSVQRIDEIPAEETVRSFDVSEEMGILLLTSENHVLYWDQAGNMTAAFSFHTSGTAGIAWDHDLICLFLTRGNLVLKFSVDGEIREVLRLEHLDYTTQKSWDAQAYREEKEVSSGTYTLLRRSGLAAAIHEHEYLKLVFLEKATGKETTLYDVSRQVFIKDLLLLVLAAALIVVLLLIVIGYRKKKKSEAGAGDSDTCQ